MTTALCIWQPLVRCFSRGTGIRIIPGGDFGLSALTAYVWFDSGYNFASVYGGVWDPHI